MKKYQMLYFVSSTFNQLDWYNAYNLRIREEIGPALLQLDDQNAAYNWMEEKTKPMKYSFVIGSGNKSGLSKGAKIAISVTVPIVFLIVVALGILAKVKKDNDKDSPKSYEVNNHYVNDLPPGHTNYYNDNRDGVNDFMIHDPNKQELPNL